MMSRPYAVFFVLLGALTLSVSAFAQCTSAIPGLPAGKGVPCSNTIPGPITPIGSYDPNASASPNSGKQDRASCDADFMNQIYARSYLEANRELMISELLVTKPDSVLEYSCFDHFVADTAEYAEQLFSETNLWASSGKGIYTTITAPETGSITIDVFMGDDKLDNSLDALVMFSLDTFEKDNFVHSYLGGTTGGTGDVTDPDVAAVGTPSPPCTEMGFVWTQARCENINKTTFFRRFSDIASADPRNSISFAALHCSGNPITTGLIDLANNKGGKYAQKDRMQARLDLIAVVTGGSCGDPVPTGLIVTQNKYNYSAKGKASLNSGQSRTYLDYVCPNPGCFYRYTSTSCEKVP